MSNIKEKIWKIILLPVIGYFIIKNVIELINIFKRPWSETSKHKKLINKPDEWYI